MAREEEISVWNRLSRLFLASTLHSHLQIPPGNLNQGNLISFFSFVRYIYSVGLLVRMHVYRVVIELHMQDLACTKSAKPCDTC